MGKPAGGLKHHSAKATTGVNSHEARDFPMHAKPRVEGHASVGARTADWDGNVPMGGWAGGVVLVAAWLRGARLSLSSRKGRCSMPAQVAWHQQARFRPGRASCLLPVRPVSRTSSLPSPATPQQQLAASRSAHLRHVHGQAAGAVLDRLALPRRAHHARLRQGRGGRGGGGVG